MTQASQDIFKCHYCGTENAIKVAMLAKIQVRCGGCKLYLRDKKHIKYSYLEPKVIRHPLEQGIVDKMEKLTGIQALTQKLSEVVPEAALLAYFKASSIQASSKQYKDLVAKVFVVCKSLNILKIPEVFICHEGLGGHPLNLDILVFGEKNPFIVISPKALDTFDEMEVLIALTHELSYVYTHQMPLKMASIMLTLHNQNVLNRRLFANVMTNLNLTMQNLLVQWTYKSKLSADRVALLVSQNEQSMISYMLKLSGGMHSNKMTLGSFRDQVLEFNPQFGSEWFEQNWQLLGVIPQATMAIWRTAELVGWTEHRRGYREIMGLFGSES